MARALETDPINELEENLQCIVCLEVLTDPRTLPCCHSFCKDCLERIVQTYRGKAPRDRPIREFPCPYCRATFILAPDKHVADMPRNHFICNMVKATAVLDRGIGVPCSHNCSQSYSVARCVTCEKFLCRECLTVHNSYRGHNGHSVLTMEELSKPENRKKINDKMYCKEHSGMILKVYCETCDQLICRDCMDFKHVKKGHSCVLVKDVANNYKELLASNCKAMEDALTEGNAVLRRLMLTTIEVDRDAENTKSKIAQRKEFVAKKVIDMLDQEAEILLKKVDEIHKGKRANLDRQAEGTKLHVKNVKTSAQLLKKLVDQGTEEEIISSQKMILNNANHLLTNHEEYFKAPIPVAKLRYTVSTSKAALNEEILRGLENSLGNVNEDREAVVTEMQANSEYDRTILVSGLPEGVRESTVLIHFQKKRNGGGDIEKITLLAGGKAMVVFENPKVAKVVVNTEQIFKERVLEVKRLETEIMKENVEKLRNEKGEKETRRVLVSGLPEGTTENNVHIHFQKKKNGGGEIEKVELLGEGKAIVVFVESRVAEQVITQDQNIKGKIVHVELVETKPRANLQTSIEAGTSEQESGTVLVSGLPEGATENGVHIQFQKKKNGGGEIKEVKLLPGKKQAIVVFESMEVAKRVINTQQVFKGKVLDVKLQESKIENVEKSRTILVSGLPEGVTESDVHIHFQKKKNGGGEVEKVTVLPEGNTALVVFEDPEVARRVVMTQQEMKGKPLTVTFPNKDISLNVGEEQRNFRVTCPLRPRSLESGRNRNSSGSTCSHRYRTSICTVSCDPRRANLCKLSTVSSYSSNAIENTVTEQTPYSMNKPQKRTRVPLLRQNKPDTRQNAAKFSSLVVKLQQPKQESPAPKESNKNSVNDKSSTYTTPNKEGDQTATTQNSKTLITTAGHNHMIDEELD